MSPELHIEQVVLEKAEETIMKLWKDNHISPIPSLMKIILLVFGGRAEHPCYRVELGEDIHIAKGVASIQVLLDMQCRVQCRFSSIGAIQATPHSLISVSLTTIQFSECTRNTGPAACLCVVWWTTPPVTLSTRYTVTNAVQACVCVYTFKYVHMWVCTYVSACVLCSKSEQSHGHILFQ